MTNQLKNREAYLVIGFISIYVIVNLVFGFFEDATWDDDCPGRYYNTLDAFNTPRHFISKWTRPLFVLIFAPIVHLGRDSIFISMVIFSAIGSYYLYKGVREVGYENSFMIVPFLLFQTYFFCVSRNALTEPLSVVLLCLGFYFLVKKKWLGFVIVGGLMPLARLELSVLLAFWGWYLLKEKQFKYIPILINEILEPVFNETQMKTGNRDKIVFFHSAGMNPYRKGTDLLIKSFSKLNHSKSKLVIHTQINLNKFFPEIKKIITELSKNGRLEIINKTVTSPGLYHRGDIYVYPTRLEGIGLSIAEANACGMPVITTNNPPMSEFIINGVNGHLIDVYSKNKRKDGYYWKESHIDEVHLESILQEYCENIGEIKQRKKSALLYAKEHLSWQKNSYGLIKAVKGATVLEDKEEVIKQIRAYKKSNGFKLYITNIIVYQKLRRV